MTSATSVAEPRQFRMLVAPYQVPPKGRRKTRNAGLDQVQSFAVKPAQSARIHPAQSLATPPDVASTRATLSPKWYCCRLAVCLRQHETASRQDYKCRCECPPAGCTISRDRRKAAFPRSRDRPLSAAIVALQKQRGRSHQSWPPVRRQIKCWPASRLDELNPSGALPVIPWQSGCRCRARGVPPPGPETQWHRRGSHDQSIP